MISLFLTALLATAQADGAAKSSALPPLSEDQLTRLRALVRETQSTAEKLRGELAELEGKLADEYAKYELDVAAAEKLQAEIIVRQRKLLANYHQLQVELRKLVGPERFAQLKRRLDNSFRPPGKADPPRATKTP